MEAVSDSYDILILCNRAGIAHHSQKWPLIWDNRCKESRQVKLVMWPLCALTVEAILVRSLCSLLPIPVSLILFSPCDSLQPTAVMLIIWRLRWASLTLLWRRSVGCCCSVQGRRAVLDRRHEIQRKVCTCAPAWNHTTHSMLKLMDSYYFIWRERSSFSKRVLIAWIRLRKWARNSHYDWILHAL